MHPRDTHSSPEDEETNTRKRCCPEAWSVAKLILVLQCDGASPCNRCQSDNAICVFGERKKSHDKVYPKGYVEMLEQQQDKLVNALQELYDRNLNRKAWPGPPLQKTAKGIPLTHDILDRLGLLKLDDQGNYETFEEDTDVLRQKMIIKEEEPAYPTPNTTQSEFSPVSPNFEPFVSRAFANETALPATRFQPTPPMHSPEEDTSMTFPEPSLNLGTSMNLDPASLQSPSQTWLRSASRYVPNMDYNYDVGLSYNGMGLMQQKANPCLPMSAWNDDDIGPLGLGPVLS
ncbi:MAG: hypothetical protein Q9161_001074 [Pseudevernia consocians]